MDAGYFVRRRLFISLLSLSPSLLPPPFNYQASGLAYEVGRTEEVNIRIM